MTIEFYRAREITKKAAKFAAGSATAALALLSASCKTTIESTHFPPCSSDAQIKFQTLKLTHQDFWGSTNDHEANVDGVVFRLISSIPSRIDIKSDDGRINYFRAGHIQFKGISDGRTYDVIFPSDSLKRTVPINITAVCYGNVPPTP